SICSLTVLPRLAPDNTRQDEYNRHGTAGHLEFEVAECSLLRHVSGWIVVIETIRPFLQASSDKVEFSRMQIPRGWIHSESVFEPCGGDALGRADCSGV